MSDLADRLVTTPDPEEPPHRRGKHPTGFEFEHDGHAGWIQTGPLAERPKTWDEFILDAGLDPNEVEVVEPVQVRGWDSPVGEGNVVRMRYYRLTVRRRHCSPADIDDLVKAAKRRARQKNTENGTLLTSDEAFVVALGDLQIGKMENPTDSLVDRFMKATTDAVKRYKRIAKGSPIYLLHLGDCTEGFVSQGGANAWRTPLTITEQVRIYRRLLLEQVKAFSAVAPKLVVAGIPGNHDEAFRPLQTYGDSWAIEGIEQVRDAINLAGTYEHVTMLSPARDELTLTLDVCGTIIGIAHGHQFRTTTKAIDWWARQSHGRQSIGDADLLLTGHFHHLRIEQTGSDKTWIQAPALEEGSRWWKHRMGEWGQPGVLSFMAGGGKWHSLEIL